MPRTPHRLHVIMGVAGCGKSTIGNAIAAKLDGTYLEGDQFHPSTNIEKMSAGVPLTDGDRWPWLKIVSQEMAGTDGIVFTGCSALKRAYRDYITEQANEPVLFIHLNGSKELITSRMGKREGHFMPDSLIESQFEALEPPGTDEISLTVDISGTEEDIVQSILNDLNRLG